MEWLTQTGYYLFCLSVIIIIHELGHFIPAKLFGVKVEKFYLFFNPYFSLLKIKIRETEYGIGWLPVGGYVIISGLLEELENTDKTILPIPSWKFGAKTKLQQFIILFGGVFANIFSACIIYFMFPNFHFLHSIMYANIIDAFVNILPFGSLDGAKIVQLLKNKKR